MEDCLFCKLSTGNPNILYENSSCYVILDVCPLSKGHLLVIPRKHGAYLHEYDEQDLKEVLPTIQKIIKCLGLKKYNILQNNGHIQSILHVHFHIVPMTDDDNCLKVNWQHAKIPQDYVKDTIHMLQEKFSKI